MEKEAFQEQNSPTIERWVNVCNDVLHNVVEDHLRYLNAMLEVVPDSLGEKKSHEYTFGVSMMSQLLLVQGIKLALWMFEKTEADPRSLESIKENLTSFFVDCLDGEAKKIKPSKQREERL